MGFFSIHAKKQRLDERVYIHRGIILRQKIYLRITLIKTILLEG